MKNLSLKLLLVLFLNTINVFCQTQIGQNLEISEPFFSFAFSVSSSYNGNIIAVGGYGKNDWGFRVYEFDGTNWLQVGNDIATEYPNNISAYEVAISADGDRVAVGAVINATPDYGKVRIYEFDSSNWTQIGNELTGESNHDFFGSRISLSSNGNRLIVGAKFNNNSIGNARVFEYNGVDWIQLGNDIDGDYDQNHFAESVSISHDGNRVAVGQNQYCSNTNLIYSGLVRIFDFNGIEWVQTGQNLLGENYYDNFGARISLSNDGNRIAVGATETYIREGFVQVFDFDGANWAQIGSTINGQNVGDRFGRMVSLSSDGNRLAVGSPSNKVNGNRPGLVKLYGFNNSDWVQLGVDMVGDVFLDEFGKNLSLSPDGNSIVIGALTYIYPQSGTEEGYAKVFDLSDLLSLDEIEFHSINIYPNPATKNIQIINSQIINEVNIFDSTGKLIKKDINFLDNIDISNIQNGFYFINLVTIEGKSRSVKLIKK